MLEDKCAADGDSFILVHFQRGRARSENNVSHYHHIVSVGKTYFFSQNKAAVFAACLCACRRHDFRCILETKGHIWGINDAPCWPQTEVCEQACRLSYTNSSHTHWHCPTVWIGSNTWLVVLRKRVSFCFVSSMQYVQLVRGYLHSFDQLNSSTYSSLVVVVIYTSGVSIFPELQSTLRFLCK